MKRSAEDIERIAELKAERDALAARCDEAERLRDRYRAEARHLHWKAANAESARDNALAERDTAEEERDVLASHVERIKAFWVLIDRGVSIPSQRWKLDELIQGAPATSLARLKAEWQAEALERVSKQRPPGSMQRAWLEEEAEKIRQAEEGDT